MQQERKESVATAAAKSGATAIAIVVVVSAYNVWRSRGRVGEAAVRRAARVGVVDLDEETSPATCTARRAVAAIGRGERRQRCRIELRFI